MGLMEALNKNAVRRETVLVTNIRINEMNDYNMEDVDALAENILDRGQMNAGLGYYEDKGDGCSITLLGGERRWRAVSQNYEKGLGDGIYIIDVCEKPKDKWEEEELIRAHNIQREKTNDEIFREIKFYERKYEYLMSAVLSSTTKEFLKCINFPTDEIKKEIEKENISQETYDYLLSSKIDNFMKEEIYQLLMKPTGTKRDWIGKKVGKSGRRVDDYLKLRKSTVSVDAILKESEEREKERTAKAIESRKTKDNEKPITTSKSNTKLDVIKLINNSEKALEKAMIISENVDDEELFNDISKALEIVRKVAYVWNERK